MWESHTPFPFNQVPNSYSFMVRHGFLWRMAYHSLNPPALHLPYMSAVHAFTAAHLHRAFDE
jgi:1,2-diacylglycerol 3-beta-galactosyltransferase